MIIGAVLRDVFVYVGNAQNVIGTQIFVLSILPSPFSIVLRMSTPPLFISKLHSMSILSTPQNLIPLKTILAMCYSQEPQNNSHYPNGPSYIHLFLSGHWLVKPLIHTWTFSSISCKRTRNFTVFAVFNVRMLSLNVQIATIFLNSDWYKLD